MAADTIRAHKLRSILTTLGVLIGVGAVLINVAMLRGFDIYFREEISEVGANFIHVRAGEPFEVEQVGSPEIYFEEHIFNSLSRLPHVRGATASREVHGSIKYRGEKEEAGVRGVRPGYFEATETEIIEGTAFGPQDKYSIIIGLLMKESAFSRPIGVRSSVELTLMTRDLKVTKEFKVKGIYEPGGMMVGAARGVISIVYIPISTMNDILNQDGYTSIGLYADSPEAVDIVKTEAIKTLDRQLRLPPLREQARETSREGEGGLLTMKRAEKRRTEFLAMMREREEYSIITSEDVIGFAQEISSVIGLLFIGIASISLVVGGIGIANIMLVTVTERTREIGVMKAVGAKNWDVLTIFLVEAGMIGLIGGIIGLGLAYGASETVIPYLAGFPGIIPISWIGIALGLSFGVGVISGFYPAMRAAKMDPVEALSYE